MRWTWEELLLAGADGDEDNIIDLTGESNYGNVNLIPNWPAKWAKQRYKMINLLRFARIYKMDIEEIYGWTSTMQNTRKQAYESAINNTIPSEAVNISSKVSCNEYEMYGNMYYGMDFYFCKKCKPTLPTNVTDSWLVGYFHSQHALRPFDPLGSSFKRGWNKVQTDINGYFINGSSTIPYPAAWDRVDDYEGGWSSYESKNGSPGCLIYADFNPLFNFKEVQTAA